MADNTPINPNTPVTGNTPDQSAPVAGDGPLTFAELEKALDAKKPKSQASKDAESSKKSKEGGDDEKSDKSKDLSSDTDKGKKEKQEAKDSKSSKEKEDKPEKKEEVKPKKTLKYKKGEDEAELDEDAVFTAIINGKPEQVTARDLLNNFSGKTNWDKKYSESHRQAQEFKGKYEQTQAKLKALFEEKDPDQRMWKMAEFAGMNPVQFKKFYLDDNMPLLEKWYSMTDDEKKSYLLEEENKYLKHQTENLSRSTQAREQQEVLAKKIDQLRQAHNVEENEFWTTYESLAALADEGKLEIEGIKSAKELNPEKVIEIVQKERLWVPASEALSQTNIPESQHAAILTKLVDLAYQEGLTSEDVTDMISELYGAKKVKAKIEEKIKEDNEFKTGKKETPKKTDDVWSFDQI